jgi:hypothetical protein
MGTMPVVVHQVLGQNLLEVAAAEDEKSVEALSADGPHETFGDGVGVRLQLHPVVKIRALS